MAAFVRTSILMSKSAFSTIATAATTITSETLGAATAAGATTGTTPKFDIPKSYTLRGSRKRLIQHGIKALLPTAEIRHPENYAQSDTSTINIATLPGSERLWKAPIISKRKAAMLRKESIRNGTYGSFDHVKGVGWDPMWDIGLKQSNPKGLGRYTALRLPKKSERKRTREIRAQKIENAMIGMDERMEELQAAKHRNKPPVTFESTYKELMKVKK